MSTSCVDRGSPQAPLASDPPTTKGMLRRSSTAATSSSAASGSELISPTFDLRVPAIRLDHQLAAQLEAREPQTAYVLGIRGVALDQGDERGIIGAAIQLEDDGDLLVHLELAVVPEKQLLGFPRRILRQRPSRALHRSASLRAPRAPGQCRSAVDQRLPELRA